MAGKKSRYPFILKPNTTNKKTNGSNEDKRNAIPLSGISNPKQMYYDVKSDETLIEYDIYTTLVFLHPNELFILLKE